MKIYCINLKVFTFVLVVCLSKLQDSHPIGGLYNYVRFKYIYKYINFSVTSHLRDSLILEYGSLLMDHKSLWSVGLSYLASCPPEGLKRAELLLERLPIDTEAKAMRVVAQAKKYGLVDVGEWNFIIVVIIFQNSLHVFLVCRYV